MNTHSDADRDDLKRHMSGVADEVAKFAWIDLAERIPLRKAYVRPDAEGPYMAVTWDADWQVHEGGPILINVQGFLDPDCEEPASSTDVIVPKRRWIERLFRWNVR